MSEIWLPGDSDFALAVREPRLLVPYQYSQTARPNPNYGIGIKNWFFYQSGNTLINALSGSAKKLGTNAITQRATPFGTCIDLANTAGSDLTTDACFQLPTLGVQPEGTIYCAFFPDNPSSSGIQYIFAHSDSLDDRRLYIKLKSSKLYVTIGYSIHESDGLNVIANTINTVAIAWKDGSATILVNGVLQTRGYTRDPGSDLADVTIIGQFRRTGFNLEAYDGGIFDFRFDATRHPDQALRDYCRNPFAAYQSANDAPFFVTESAGGGTPTLSSPSVINVLSDRATPQVTLTF